MENQINSLLIGQLGELDDEELQAEYLTLFGPESVSTTEAAKRSPEPAVVASSPAGTAKTTRTTDTIADNLPEVPTSPILPPVPTNEIVLESNKPVKDSASRHAVPA